MKKMKLFSVLSVVLAVVMMFSSAAFAAEEDDIVAGLFANSAELIEWINTVDVETVDDMYKDIPVKGMLSMKPIIEEARADREILVPKFMGKELSRYDKNMDKDISVVVMPVFAMTNGKFIVFMDEELEIQIVVHRIEDEDLAAADADYKKYFEEKYDAMNGIGDSMGLLLSESSAYKRIGRYDVIVDVDNYENLAGTSEKIFRGLTFDKVKLSDSSVVETYSFDDYYTRDIEYRLIDNEIHVFYQFGGNALLGDVDRDDVVTAADARAALRKSAGVESYSWAEQMKMDVDFDGKVTAADARLILRVSAKMQEF